MANNEITTNCQSLFKSNGFRRLWSDKWIEVEVLRDWDRNRIVKVVDGKIKAEMPVPCNWTDHERHEGRKWIVVGVAPTMGLHLTPQVEIGFYDKRMGKVLTKKF